MAGPDEILRKLFAGLDVDSINRMTLPRRDLIPKDTGKDYYEVQQIKGGDVGAVVFPGKGKYKGENIDISPLYTRDPAVLEQINNTLKALLVTSANPMAQYFESVPGLIRAGTEKALSDPVIKDMERKMKKKWADEDKPPDLARDEFGPSAEGRPMVGAPTGYVAKPEVPSGYYDPYPSQTVVGPPPAVEGVLSQSRRPGTKTVYDSRSFLDTYGDFDVNAKRRETRKKKRQTE